MSRDTKFLIGFLSALGVVLFIEGIYVAALTWQDQQNFWTAIAAIGTVLAVFAAIGIATFQHRLLRDSEVAEHRRRARYIALTIYPALTQIQGILGAVNSELDTAIDTSFRDRDADRLRRSMVNIPPILLRIRDDFHFLDKWGGAALAQMLALCEEYNARLEFARNDFEGRSRVGSAATILTLRPFLEQASAQVDEALRLLRPIHDAKE